jgi:predicted transcriptional regulator
MPEHRNHPNPKRALSYVVRYADLIDLLRDGPRRKRTLADRLDVSPETVYRRTRDLRDVDLLERTDAGYALTNLGRLYARQYESFRAFGRRLYDVRGVLEQLDDVPPCELFEGADFVPVEQHAPDEPRRRLAREVRRADRVSVIFPVLTRRHVALLEDHVSGGGRARVVLDASVADHLRENDSSLLGDLWNRESVSVRRSDDAPSYGILLNDGPETESATVSVYDERGALRSVVTNDAGPAVSWAADAFEQCWTDATPLSP